MNSLNSIIIEGEIKESSFSEKDNTLALILSVSRTYKALNNEEKEEISEFEACCVGALAKHAKNTLARMEVNGVRVVGRLQQYKWKDEDGEHSKIRILAEHIEFRKL